MLIITKHLLQKIDEACCKYLGLDQEDHRPNCVAVEKNEVVIISNDSYKRHLYKEKLSDYMERNSNQSHHANVGAAVGKLIASDLCVTFDKIKIKS